MAEQARSLPTAPLPWGCGGVAAVQQVILPMVAAKSSGLTAAHGAESKFRGQEPC